MIAVAEKLRAGVAKALLGKAAVARRSSLRHRLDRAARHEAELATDDRVRHAADGRLGLPLFRVPARRRQGARRPDRHRARNAVAPLSDGGQPGRRRQETLRALLPLLNQKTNGAWRDGDRERSQAMVEDARRARHAAGEPDQSAARDLGVVAAPAGRRDRHQRFGLVRQLVRARPQGAARHDVFAVRRPCVDGRGGALRDRREIRASRSAGRSRWSATARCR